MLKLLTVQINRLVDENLSHSNRDFIQNQELPNSLKSYGNPDHYILY